MYWQSLVPALLAAIANAGTLRFSCSQLVVERLDPLVNSGLLQTPHVHQIVGDICQTINYINLHATTARKVGLFVVSKHPLHLCLQ